MNTHRSIALCLAGVLAGGARADRDDYVADQAVVELDDECACTIEEINADYGTTVLGAIPQENLYLLHLPAGMTEEEFEQLLEQDPRIEEAELNHDTEAPEGQTQSFFVAVPEVDFATQYAWGLIDLAEAQLASTGAGTVVAILDSGVDGAHPALNGRIAAGGFDFVDGDADPADAGNGLDDDGDGAVDEMAGHGTFMAGLVAAVAPDATILPIRVLDGDGVSNVFFVAMGIYHAVAQGAHVINLSLAASSDNAILDDAIEAAHAAGAIVVAAAGNSNSAEPAHPAAHPLVIAVAATDAADVRCPFSNFGAAIAMSAPGLDVVSALPGNGYGRWSGTSMSAALVSGSAALVHSALPGAGPAQVKAVLQQAAEPIDAANPGFEGQLGSGRLEAAGSLPPIPLPGDVDGDGVVNVADLVAVVAAWGPCPPAGGCAADGDGDGAVGVTDLLLVILHWSGL
jgi:subtilisin family serine protease